ncbi:hypothetical protein BDR26DRAFT_717091 [Obelidium mucronatum]|nr:hypothetical protein BDR26DRAFT_717091 [Obelidium mucronatum]
MSGAKPFLISDKGLLYQEPEEDLSALDKAKVAFTGLFKKVTEKLNTSAPTSASREPSSRGLFSPVSAGPASTESAISQRQPTIPIQPQQPPMQQYPVMMVQPQHPYGHAAHMVPVIAVQQPGYDYSYSGVYGPSSEAMYQQHPQPSFGGYMSVPGNEWVYQAQQQQLHGIRQPSVSQQHAAEQWVQSSQQPAPLSNQAAFVPSVDQSVPSPSAATTMTTTPPITAAPAVTIAATKESTFAESISKDWHRRSTIKSVDSSINDVPNNMGTIKSRYKSGFTSIFENDVDPSNVSNTTAERIAIKKKNMTRLSIYIVMMMWVVVLGIALCRPGLCNGDV